MKVRDGLIRWCLIGSFCFSQILIFAQTTKVAGLITDAATGETLPFVNVAFIDSKISTVTDLDGNYVLDTYYACLLYTSDAADERSSVDLGGRRIIKKQKKIKKKI